MTGAPLNAIGLAAERTARRHGGTVHSKLCGHGVGRGMHEPPNAHVPSLRQPLTAGLVLAVEPMFGFGGSDLVRRDDGWTIATADGSPAAHAEHTLVVATGRPCS